MTRHASIHRLATLAILGSLLVSLSGCMTSGPIAGCYNPKAKFDAIKPGIDKAALDAAIGETGLPIGDGRAVLYRFQHTDVKRSRAGWFMAIDVFTAFTAEIFFTPIEYFGVYRPSQRSGIGVFDGEGKLIAFREMHQNAEHQIGIAEAPPHNQPGPYSEAWDWATFWGRGRTNCVKGE
jgi:hypothetical protein